MSKHPADREITRQAILESMQYEEEITIFDTGVEAAGICGDGADDYSLSLMVESHADGYEIILTEKELRKVLNTIKKLKAQ